MSSCRLWDEVFFAHFYSFSRYFNVLGLVAVSAITAGCMRLVLVPSAIQWTLQLERPWNCSSCTMSPFLVSMSYCKGLSQEVLSETLLSLRALVLLSVCERVVWSAFAHAFETDSNLGFRCSVLGLGNSLDQKCLQLIFPLRFSFLYWFSIFSTRLITSKIPIYIQILLNSASYILGTFSSINQFFKERDSIIRSIPDDSQDGP